MATAYTNVYQWQDLSFGEWTQELDKAVKALSGLSLHDLPDVPYADWYEDRVSPKAAAKMAIRAAMED